MKRTQITQGKLTTKYLGPYEVTDVGPRERYVVVKMGVHEGPNRTSTVADQMKPWRGTHYNINQRAAEQHYSG